ncbi:MAG: UbiA family prenyltransferase [Methanomicrobiales archaeon]|nr:UbiA family prenyltransferase [Methanomicrobiales archaeon]
MGVVQKLKASLDLTRAHFLIVWPILFSSGLFLAFENYGGFDILLVAKVVAIAIFGFEAGLVLNDYIDRTIDTRDVESSLTRYWRPFGSRPIAQGLISPMAGFLVFLLCAAIAIALILTIEPPHSWFVLGFLAYSYTVEAFYQLKKRRQRFPVAQIVGRTDLALFPVAGYLSWGFPDATALLYFVFLYPWALAHLGVNDLADVRNDRARNLTTIPVLYGMRGGMLWVGLFSALHLAVAFAFFWGMGPVPKIAAILAGFCILGGNSIVIRNTTPESSLRALPLFHVSLLLYAVGILGGYWL